MKMSRILLVEDEKDVAAYITDLLQGRGYEVVCAYRGKDAMGLLQSERFDLAIVDLILPDMGGNDVCAMIRHNNRIKDLPIIVSTGIGDDFTQAMSRELGANEFLSKPYAMEELLSAVKRCLEIK